MGQVHQLTSGLGSSGPAPAERSASVAALDEVRCALCGRSLVGGSQRYRMVSPLAAMGAVTVCRTCRKAALAEGYRPER